MGWDEIKAWMNNAARAAAGVVSPPAHSPGAVGIAGIRSILPGSGSFSQEFDRYNRDAAPSPLYSPTSKFGSVVTDPAKPLMPAQGERERQMQMAMQMPMMGPIAYHGSPHVFDKFSMQKIGTGEGAQAYGHGLYFSAEPQIAEGYRANLARPNRLLVGGAEMGDSSIPRAFNELLDDWYRPPVVDGVRGPVRTSKAPSQEDISAMRSILELKRDFWLRESEKFKSDPRLYDMNNRARAEAQEAIDFLSQLKPEDFSVTGNGSFHVVDIPDNLLDWDAPLADQPQIVDKLKEAGFLSPKQGGGFVFTPDGPMGHGTAIDLASESGNAIYDKLGYVTKKAPPGSRVDSIVTHDRPTASQRLRDLGIPGHAYKGESSGVTNFVVYDDSVIKPKGRWSSLQEFLRSQEAAP